MICPKCGKWINDSAKFCEECGNPIYYSRSNPDITSSQTQQKKNVNNRKKTPLLIFIVCFVVMCLIVTQGKNPNQSKNSSSSSSNSSHSSSSSSSSKSYNSYSSSKSSSFTNKFGTSTTKCAHSGCNNYIAPSGNTNCCTTHSNRCLDCNCYIDEDAMYCIDCLVKAYEQATGQKYNP